MSNEGKGGWYLGLTVLQHPCAHYVEIWEPRPTGTLWVWKASFVLLEDSVAHMLNIGARCFCVWSATCSGRLCFWWKTNICLLFTKTRQSYLCLGVEDVIHHWLECILLLQFRNESESSRIFKIRTEKWKFVTHPHTHTQRHKKKLNNPAPYL